MARHISRGELVARLLIVVAVAICAAWSKHGQAQEIPREAARYRQELTRNARLVWGIDAPVATFAAQIHQESRWRPDATSPVGAQGLAQFMPSTAEWISAAYPDLNTPGDELPPAGRQPAGVGSAYNSAWALRALVTYDLHLWERTSSASPCEHMAKVLSGYNGGIGWVRRDERLAQAQGANPAVWFNQVERFNAGRSTAAFRENRGYPRRILLTLEPLYVAAGYGPGVCA